MTKEGLCNMEDKSIAVTVAITESTEQKENYKKHMSALERYKINEKLGIADIFHMYPKEPAFPNGYHDSCFFDLWIFNSETMEKRFFPRRDGLQFLDEARIYIARIYIDGSTLIRLCSPQKVSIFQCIMIG